MASTKQSTDVSTAELYEKYCLINGKRPTLTDMDREFFAAVEKARQEGKDILFISKINARRR